MRSIDIERKIKSHDSQLEQSQNNIIASFDKNNKILNHRGVKYIGHRGMMQLAPENTIPSYVVAGESGIFGGESDIAITSDGKFVLMHDQTVDRTTDGTGDVTTLTLAQLKSLNVDVGSNLINDIKNNFSILYPNLKVPTLEEYLEVCKKYELVPVMEVKLYTAERRAAFYEILKKYSFTNDCIIISSTKSVLNDFRTMDKNIVLALLGDITAENVSYVKSLGNAFIDCEASTLNTTKTNIDYCHSQGVKVGFWVVNNIRDVQNYISYGVDFITTDILIGGI